LEKVFIALATYNGASYLKPLLESVRRQSHSAWTLLARDDRSSDATAEILRRTAAEDRRIVLLEDDLGRLGPTANFGLLMRHGFDRGAEYLLFADQDDVWQPDKVDGQLRLMRDRERVHGEHTPQLVYSDLRVVDARARTIHPSFLRVSRLGHGEGRPLRTLLGRSFVLGCACLINRPLLQFALPVPPDVASHDWWVALCGAAVGWISYLPKPTLSYRRHGNNASGSASFWAGLNPLRHPWQKRWETGLTSFRRSLAQAESLRQRLHDRAPTGAAEDNLVLEQFCGLFRRPSPPWQRVVRLCRLGIPAIDLPRRLLYYLCVLTLPRRTDFQSVPQTDATDWKSVLPGAACGGKQTAGKPARYAA
jgi:rhamnosyltransferase